MRVTMMVSHVEENAKKMAISRKSLTKKKKRRDVKRPTTVASTPRSPKMNGCSHPLANKDHQTKQTTSSMPKSLQVDKSKVMEVQEKKEKDEHRSLTWQSNIRLYSN